MSDSIQRSNGYLPLAPLRHGDPTAVGLWDLEVPAGITWPLVTDTARDQLVLARLHGQPLAILHVDERPGTESPEKLIDQVWREARTEIIGHTRTCPCLEVPSDAQTFGAMLDAAAGQACPDRVPPRPAGRAAVILCTTGRQEMLARSLESLIKMQCDDYEVIVVDNRPSVQATRTLVEGFASRAAVRYVAEPRPGLAIARNTGVAAAASAAYVAFTDDDVVVDPEWLAWLLVPFAQPQVRAVTGLVMPLSLESTAQKRFEQYAGFGKGVIGQTYDLQEHRAADRFLYPYWGGMFGSGNSMAFRRGAVLAIGGFDPALGAGTPTGGGEDIAAFSDVILGGGRLVYEPRSLCWHEHRNDENALEGQVRNYGIGLTAVFWRYLWRDRRFSITVVRSVPLVLRLLKRRNDERQDDSLPADLAALESRGRLLGPWRYIVGRRHAKRG
jgi:O-antigen biosynthesis protein